MPLSGVHFILTYRCTKECQHCFVFSGPKAEDTFTLEKLKQVFSELPKINSMRSVFFEGGEPFLYYPLMAEGVRLARKMGYEVGLVSNAYWAITESDAALWLKPLVEAGLTELGISDDELHSDDRQPAANALAAAEKLCITAYPMSLEEPRAKGEELQSGGVMFRGRAAEELAIGLPGKSTDFYKECPFEELEDPERVHVDSLGNVLICQGISMGNMWQTPLSELVNNYDCRKHPICRLLMERGPAALAAEADLVENGRYVDACHLCYLSRKALQDKYPEYLCPKRLYGAGDNAD